MKQVPYLLLVLALASVIVAGGCGSSDSATGGSDVPDSLTKKQFVKLTESFCNKEYRAEERDMEAYADKHLLVFGGGEPWEQEILNEIVFEYVEDKIDYFKSLPAPEGDEKEVQAMVGAFEDGLKNSERNPANLAEPRINASKNQPDYWGKSYETTTAYGPWLCGQP